MPEVEVRPLASLLCFCYCQKPAGGKEKKFKKIRLSTSSGKKPKLYLGCITLFLLKFLISLALEKWEYLYSDECYACLPVSAHLFPETKFSCTDAQC